MPGALAVKVTFTPKRTAGQIVYYEIVLITTM
jgi:hypothetical protein